MFNFLVQIACPVKKTVFFHHNIFELDNRATSMDFLKPKEAKAKLDPRDGWLFKLKSKFTEDEMLFLEDEFDDLECIGMIQTTKFIKLR